MITWEKHSPEGEYPYEIGRCGKLLFKATAYNLFIGIKPSSGPDHYKTCKGIEESKRVADEYVRSIVQDFNRTEGKTK